MAVCYGTEGGAAGTALACGEEKAGSIKGEGAGEGRARRCGWRRGREG